MRAAIDAALHDLPLAEVAPSYMELAQALESWGEFGSPKMRSLFALA